MPLTLSASTHQARGLLSQFKSRRLVRQFRGSITPASEGSLINGGEQFEQRWHCTRASLFFSSPVPVRINDDAERQQLPKRARQTSPTVRVVLKSCAREAVYGPVHPMRTLKISCGATVLMLSMLNGCQYLEGGGGGTGGGAGGGSDVTFKSGFVFVRKDDRNVYVVDESDVQTTGTLTQTGAVRTPSLSKDGKRVVFARGAAAESNISIVAVSGGTASTVLSATAQLRNLKTPVFSPDGTRVAFSFDEGSGTSTSIGIINTDGTGFLKLASGGLAQASPSFTPDGSALLVAAGGVGSGLTQIEKITLAGNIVANVTNTLGAEAQEIVNRVLISPDGHKAVFDARVSSGDTRLFTIDLDTKQVTPLYSGEAGTHDTFPCWMGNGAVAFSSDSGGNDNLYKVNLPMSNSATLLVPKAIEPWYGP